MRFLHSSDWHLGRLLHEVRLLEDQSHLLDQILAMAQDLKPDFLLIAGDIYDKAVPPPEAVELLGDFLARLILDCKVPALMLSGNHDSAKRLGFCARLLSGQGLVISGSLKDARKPVTFMDSHGPVDIHLLPYADPAEVREAYPQEDARGHNEAMAALLRNLENDPSRRRILACHAFVAGGAESDSERPLSVGGTGAVDSLLFEGFQYAALGHLHRPQRIGSAGEIHYSGSLFKYSISERDHIKGVNLVEMGGEGSCKVDRIPFSLKRDLRRIEGSLEDLLRPAEDGGRGDYLEAVLTDEGPLLQPMERLRGVYPNMLHIERPYLSRGHAGGRVSAGDHRTRSDADLFGSFFRQVSGRELSASETAVFASAVAGAAGERETAADAAIPDPEASASGIGGAPAPARARAASGRVPE